MAADPDPGAQDRCGDRSCLTCYPAMDEEENRRLLIALRYEGPWARACDWFYAIDWRTGDIWREVRPGSLREKLADFCERRDHAWQRRWAARWPDQPAPRWRRRTTADPGHAGER